MLVIRKTIGILVALAIAGLLVLAGMFYTGNLDYQAYILESNSMAPTMPTGTLVIVDTTSDIQEGDVIVYQVGDTVVTHRLVEVEEDGTIVTQGDAMTQVDPFPVTTDDIIGEVVYSSAALGGLVLFLQTPAGIFSVLALAASVLIGAYAIGAIRSARRPEDEVQEAASAAEDREPVTV